jgi:MYXO-CTERM domain-containing protein
VANEGQEDEDQDGEGDACEPPPGTGGMGGGGGEAPVAEPEPPTFEGGCACRTDTSGAPGGDGGSLLVLVLGAALVWRRRRAA